MMHEVTVHDRALFWAMIPARTKLSILLLRGASPAAEGKFSRYTHVKPWVIYYKHRACMGECRFQWGRDVGVELTWMPFPPHNVWLCNFFSLIIRMKTNLEFWLPWLRRICHLMKQLGLLKNWNPGVQPGIYFCKRHMLRLGQRQKRNSHSMPKETGYSSSKFKDQRVCRKSLRFVVCLLFLILCG